MKQNELEALKKWFNNYVHEFKSDDKDISKNLKLKLAHTHRVCLEILSIGKELKLNDSQLNLAEAMALFHDVGRFEQYAKYRTYLDMKSENHAELVVKILKQKQIVRSRSVKEQFLIEKAISNHKRKEVPVDESDEECLFCSRLLRDADKLVIWKVVTEYYQKKTGEGNGAIVFGLPDTDKFSDDACNNLLSKKVVEINQISTVNDLRLLQIGWIYDVTFPATFRKVLERHYLKAIRDHLPSSDKIDNILKIAYDYIYEKGGVKKGSS